MKFNPDYILENYEKEMLGEYVVFFPSKKSNKLLVLFSAMNDKNKYDRLSWFWDEKEEWISYSILYISDTNYTYYLGTPEKPMFHTYEKIIKYFQTKILANNKNTVTVGSSMGGYGAILFAYKMGLNRAITGVPNINKKSALMHNYTNWYKSMQKTGDLWIDLDILLRRNYRLPNLYIEYGNYSADNYSIKDIKEIYDNSISLLCLQKGSVNDHKYFMSKITINSFANLFFNNNFIDNQ